MFGSSKGHVVNFCLVALFTATTVCAQEPAVANAINVAYDNERPTDVLRTRSSVDATKNEPESNTHLTPQPSTFPTMRNEMHISREMDVDPRTDLSATVKETKGQFDPLEVFKTSQWVEKDLRQHIREGVRFPSPMEDRFDREKADDPDDPDDPISTPPLDKFHWKPAIYQSLIAQGFQHGYALIFQEKTQRALKGPFFRDYWESIKGVRGWSDGNRFFTNYIAHPMQGSMTGFIYAQNHDRVKKQIFNESKQYWKDRAMALVWSTAWSTNWEIGPISQASLGNVGYYGHGGYVDLVITPTVGTAWMITEEALDRYIIRHAEGNLAVRILLRTFLNPTRSVANVLRFKKPWYRDRAH